MENYISYLINIACLSLKKDLAIETSYSLIYNKGRKNEKVASNLAGYDVRKFFYFINYRASNK